MTDGSTALATTDPAVGSPGGTVTPAAHELLGWLVRPSTDRGIHFARADGEWDFWPYQRLAELTRQVAAGLRERGLPPGRVVALVQRSSPQFVAGFFGTLLAGGAPAPIAPPMAFQDAARYREHLTGLLRAARPHLVLTEPDLVDRVRGSDAGDRAVTVSDVARPAAPDPADVALDPGALALLQFTSGSSGRARGVRVPAAALRANVTAIRRWLRWTSRDPVASWLPVHHDMGLIGCLVTPVVSGSDLWLLPPEEFLHRPLRYLRCFGALDARLTAMPMFGLAHIVRRVSPDQLRGLDFSGWRAAIVGAEHLDAGWFDRFHTLLAPFGLDRRALLPAYGLAEATLAVTGLPLPEQWRAVPVDPASLSPGEPVRMPGDGSDGALVVGCGRPLHGLHVSIVDEDRQPLPDRRVGEVEVSGDSVASGYVDGADRGLTRFAGGRLRTGDAGFLDDGQLFVLGRLGDSLKLRGRAVFAEDVEATIAAAGIPAGRVAVALGRHRDLATAVIVLEEADDAQLRAAQAAAHRRTEGARTVLVVVARGGIARTTSGKVRRRQLWQAYVDGRLAGAEASGGLRQPSAPGSAASAGQ